MNNPMTNPEQITQLPQSTMEPLPPPLPTEPIEPSLFARLAHNRLAQVVLATSIVVAPTFAEGSPAVEQVTNSVEEAIGVNINLPYSR